jgi:hypothetical protein
MYKEKKKNLCTKKKTKQDGMMELQKTCRRKEVNIELDYLPTKISIGLNYIHSSPSPSCLHTKKKKKKRRTIVTS